MDIIQEIMAMRKRVLQQINTEFDILLEHTSQGAAAQQQENEQTHPSEIRYSLTEGSKFFKGKKPMRVIIEANSYSIQRWKQFVETVLKVCVQEDRYRTALIAAAGNVSGKKRTILGTSPEGMRSPVEIMDNLYVETHYDTETLLNILVNRILLPIGYDAGSIYVVLR